MEATLRYHPVRFPWLILLAGLMLVGLAIPPATATVHSGLHEEYDLIRSCAADPANLAQVWLNSSGERLNCLVNLPDGKIGNLVLQWCKKSGWIEITAYLIGDGTLKQAVQVLRAKACQQVYP